MARAVPFVGLTGGLGAGKSTALAALERLGAAPLPPDGVARELSAGEEVRGGVGGGGGGGVAPDGVVDLSAVAGRAFAPQDERQWLGELLWPGGGARVAQWREDVSAQDPP